MKRLVVVVGLVACSPSYVAGIDPEGAADGSGGPASVGDSTATSDDDDDGDTTVGDDGNADCTIPPRLPDCDAAADPLRALEVACWDGISAAEFRSDDPSGWRRAHEFGNAFWTAEDSTAVLVLSTGSLPDPDANGQVALEPGVAQLASVDNANADVLPDPLAPPPEGARDVVWFRFDADVPPDVAGYSVRFALLTAEYPEAVDANASDTFVWWHESEELVGDLATLDGQPASVPALASLLSAHAGDDPMLLRTGFDGGEGQPCTIDGESQPDCPIGASTGWLELRGPAIGGERISIVAALYDHGDALVDTVVVLDRFGWSCGSCLDDDSCGLTAP